MAKSLRSKRKRKVRAEKRIVNAKKELVKLKQIAARLHGTRDKNGAITKESIESNIPGVHVHDRDDDDDDDIMQIDRNHDGDSSSGDDDGQPRFSKKELMRINPQWMNQRKIKSIKSKIKKHNQKKSRRGKSAGLSSRKTKKSLKK